MTFNGSACAPWRGHQADTMTSTVRPGRLVHNSCGTTCGLLMPCADLQEDGINPFLRHDFAQCRSPKRHASSIAHLRAQAHCALTRAARTQSIEGGARARAGAGGAVRGRGRGRWALGACAGAGAGAGRQFVAPRPRSPRRPPVRPRPRPRPRTRPRLCSCRRLRDRTTRLVTIFYSDLPW